MADKASGAVRLDDRSGCPVCEAAIGEAGTCPRCGWELFGGFRLGPMDAAVVAAFEQSLAAARRSFDLLIAARSSSAASSCPAGISALIRGGPPEQDEWVSACLATGDDAGGATTRSVAEAVVLDAEVQNAETPVSDVRVAEVNRRGMTVTSFDISPDGQFWERAAIAARRWPELVPELSFDEDERLFQLAGGIGVRPLGSGQVSAALASTLPAAAAELDGTVVVVNRLAGWPAADAVEAGLLAAIPEARPVRQPPVSSGASDGDDHVVQLSAPITAAALSRSQTVGRGAVAVGRADSTIAVHDLPSGSKRGDLTGNGNGVTAVAISDDGAFAVSAGADGALSIGGMASTAPSRRLTAHNGSVTAVLIRGDEVFSLGMDGMIARTPIDGSPGDPALSVGRSYSAALAVSGDARELAVGGADANVAVWDCTTASRTASVKLGAPITALEFQPGGRTLLAGASDGSVRSLDPHRRKWVTLLSAGGPPIRVLAALDDGSVALADETGRIRRFTDGLQGGTAPAIVGVHSGSVAAIGLADDGRLITADLDGLIRYWPVEPGPWAFTIMDW